jgi:hypothetical protein
VKNKIKTNIKLKNGDPVYEDINKVWDEVSFVKPVETEVERSNRTNVYEKDKIRKKIMRMREILKGKYNYQYPVERRVIEDRLNFLEKEYFRFDYMINPYHVQPGLVLDVDITSIKRKKSTLDGMANVLNEFLQDVSKGFQDAAFASFSRQRATIGGLEPRNEVRGDLRSAPTAKTTEPAPSSTYLDIINSDEAPKSAAKPKAKAAKSKTQTKKRGIVTRRR